VRLLCSNEVVTQLEGVCSRSAVPLTSAGLTWNMPSAVLASRLSPGALAAIAVMRLHSTHAQDCPLCHPESECAHMQHELISMRR
jgi:hypothetical protein